MNHGDKSAPIEGRVYISQPWKLCVLRWPSKLGTMQNLAKIIKRLLKVAHTSSHPDSDADGMNDFRRIKVKKRD